MIMKLKLIHLSLVTLILFLIFTGCLGDSMQPTPVTEPTINEVNEPGDSTPLTEPTKGDVTEPSEDNAKLDPAKEKQLLSGYSDFGFHLYSVLCKSEKEKNIFISPSSIAIALAMTYNGAMEETKASMEKTLEFNGMTMEEVNEANKKLLDYLGNTEEKVELSVANSLWCRPDIKFEEDFISRCKDNYFAEISNNFQVSAINGWVKEKTKGKIDKVLDRIPDNAILYLINAIYFKGIWTFEFDKEKTQDLDFNLPDGSKKKHPMMSQSGSFNYYRGDKFQAINLPYGEENYSMYLFLPDEDSGLEEFHSKLNKENWENWMSGFNMMEGDIIMPRFTFEYEVLLNTVLSSMGMEIAFDENLANFRGMAIPPRDENIFIQKVLHKTFVEVNEEGTEAAAVTVVEMGLTESVAEEPERFYMLVDRPFFFVIRDNKTGLILFMGSVLEPEE